MSVYALILAGGVGSRLSILTEQRAKPAVPFGGKFRIIDFPLSNCTNSGIHDVGLLTQYRPQSLREHVAAGAAWDMDRNLGGLEILQPSPEKESGGWYQGTADAVTHNLLQILRRPVEDVLILSGDHVYDMDYRPFLRFHRDRRFPATVAATPVEPEMTRQFGMIHQGADGVISGFEEKPVSTESTLASMGVYLFRRDTLIRLLQEDAEDSESTHDFGRDIFPKLIQLTDVGVYTYNGYWQDIGTLQAFYDHNMVLLDTEHREKLLHADWPIRTPSVDSPPVSIRGGARFMHSMAANGAVVAGTVENSILFPGAVVEPGAVVRNSILMNDVRVRAGATVDHAILDKRVDVGAEAGIGVGSGDVVPNRVIPELLRTGLSVLGKDVALARGARVGRNAVLGGRLLLGEGESLADGDYRISPAPPRSSAVR